LTNDLAGYGLLGLAESLLPVEVGVPAILADEGVELENIVNASAAMWPTDRGPPPARTLSKRSIAVRPQFGHGCPNFIERQGAMRDEKRLAGGSAAG
jgi:hypothetical protein